MKAKGVSPSFSIRRTESLQYETDDRSGEQIIFRIRWTEPCKYELKAIDDLDTLDQNSVRDLLHKMTTFVTILKTSDDYYVFEAKKTLSPFIYKDTLWLKK